MVTYRGGTIEYRVRTASDEVLTTRAKAPGLGGASIFPVGSAVSVQWHPVSGVLVPEA